MSRDICNHLQNLRSYLQKSELWNLENNSIKYGIWSVTPKYRFDIVIEDFNRILLHINFSIHNMEKILPDIADIKFWEPYLQGGHDMAYWYYVDQCIKSISSGWDRLAILLDIAFKTELWKNVNLHKILDEKLKDKILEKHPNLYENKDFIQLQKIQRNELQFLESTRWIWLRHEATHSMTLGTRFWFEFLEGCVWLEHKNRMQKDWFQQIQLQKEYLISWQENVIDLIESLTF